MAPPGTVTEAATGSNVLVLDRNTNAPPTGAGLLNVTVQVVLSPGLRTVGLQDSEDSTTEAARLMIAVFDTPLNVAVSVTV